MTLLSIWLHILLPLTWDYFTFLYVYSHWCLLLTKLIWGLSTIFTSFVHECYTLYPLLQPTVLLDVSYIYFHCALHLLYGPPQKWISSVCPSRSILHLDLCPWSLTCMEWISKILAILCPVGFSQLEDVTRERAESIHSRLSLPPCLFWVGCFPYPKVTVLLRPCLSLSPGFCSSSVPCLWDGNSTPLLLASEYHIVCWFS